MADESTPAFPGFPDFRSNVTFVPIQFFTIVIPTASRGCVRIVGYALRKLLGWVDELGNPTQEQVHFSYRELIEKAGVSRDAIADALREAVDKKYLRCVQTPRPDLPGQASRHGTYVIAWNTDAPYTDRPTEFSGFYYPEAAVVTEQHPDGVRHRPKAARKNIPNAFFDVLIPQERLSVIRVVGALLFYSIKWGPGGERKVPVQLSISQLSRLTHLSRQHVHEALREAQARGYIQTVSQGRFDAHAGEAATYAIHWVRDPTVVRAPSVPVGKGEQERSEKVNSHPSEKVNSMSIKTESKTQETTAPDLQVPHPAAAASALELLLKTGFDSDTARALAEMRPKEVIRRQIEWLPLRKSTRNRLGLLRRAIEQNWSRPEIEVLPADQQRGREFARHYYAAYHGNTGEPAAEPTTRDCGVGARFVDRLLALDPDEQRIPEWGRQFGIRIKQRHRTDARARPHLCSALVLYGDEFLQAIERSRSVNRAKRGSQAEEARAAERMPAYLTFLRAMEGRLRNDEAARYARFLDERRLTRQRMTGGLFLASADTLARFDSEPSRLLAFAEFFRGQVPDINTWDGHGPDISSVRFHGPAATESSGMPDTRSGPLG